MSWADEQADKWARVRDTNGGLLSVREAISIAIREALEKAAQVADNPKWDAPEQVGAAIRALMVDP